MMNILILNNLPGSPDILVVFAVHMVIALSRISLILALSLLYLPWHINNRRLYNGTRRLVRKVQLLFQLQYPLMRLFQLIRQVLNNLHMLLAMPTISTIRISLIINILAALIITVHNLLQLRLQLHHSLFQ